MTTQTTEATETTTLTTAQRRDLASVRDNAGHGGVRVRTGATLARLGLVQWVGGHAPHAASAGWILTPAGKIAVDG